MSLFPLLNLFIPSFRPSTPPRLEILSALPATPSTLPPLLFVHGAFCAAWVWEEHFLQWFADCGHPAYAVSLRGHGGSAGRERLSETSFAEYVEDLDLTVKAITAETGRAPVVVGHSMGGMIVQHWIAGQDRARFRTKPRCSGVVLLSSVPPSGLTGTSLHMALSDPTLIWQLTAMQAFGDGPHSEGLQRAMFAPDAPADLIANFYRRQQEESVRAPMDMHCSLPPDPSNGKIIPMLVLGADHDTFVTDWMNHSTAHYYHTDCIILPHTGHSIMLGPSWENAAETLHGWMVEQGLATAP